LSAKYGFLLPNESIEYYNIVFNQPGSISNEELAKQVESKEINGRKLSSFRRVYVYIRSPLYYEKACRALKNVDACVQIANIRAFMYIPIRSQLIS